MILSKEQTLRLVFHYWNGGDERINKLHFALLKHYANIFTEIIFIIAVNDESPEVINEIKHKIIDIGFKGKLTIVVDENDKNLREALTFKKYIIDKMDVLDGLTFFGHSKGGTNTVDNKPEFIFIDICMLYYGNLNWFKEVQKYLLNEPHFLTYGTFLTKCHYENYDFNYPYSKFKWYYSGTFQWLNTKKIKNFIDRNNLDIPPLTDRFYGENGCFPNLFDIFYASSHVLKYIIKKQEYFYYDNIYELLTLIFSEEEMNEFITFANNILEETLGIRYDR